MQPRSLIFKVASPLFYQPGQGKARLHPSSTSYRLARRLTPTNAQARKGVRFCLRTTLQEVCWILGGGTSALFFKSQLSERQKAASSGFWKMVLAESRRLRSSRRRSPAADRTALPSGPSRSPPPLLLHRLRTLRPGILLPLQLRQKTPKLISITSPGGPTAAVRILLNPKPFHIRCTLPGHILKTVIHTSLVQLLRRSISLQMLHLRPDGDPGAGAASEGLCFFGGAEPGLCG